MRVLTVVDSLALGGAERYVGRVSRALVQQGVDVRICALDPSGPLQMEFAAAQLAVLGTSYPRRYQRSNTLTLVDTVRDIARIARQGRFDVVHSYLFWSDVLASFGGRLAGTPRVIVSRRALHAWRHGPGHLLHGLEAASNLAATDLVANSAAVLADTLAHERFVPRRRGVVYNGIEARPAIAGRTAPTRPFRLVTVGALAPRKGQVYAIRALALVLQAGVEATLDLVGSGGDEPALRSLSAELGVEDRVLFSGEKTDPTAHLDRADLFVLPSRQEGFSNALLEAMDASLPAVATDVGGNAEALIHGRGGRIVTPESADAIASAIVQMAADPVLCVDYGRFNRARIQESFTIQASAAALARWYREF